MLRVKFRRQLKRKNPDYESVEITLSREQKQIVNNALEAVKDEIQETFGNPNQKGNALYEVVRQWAERKKSS